MLFKIAPELNFNNFLTVYKMRTKMNAHEIYQYLSLKNFNLTNDRVLKEPQSNCETIWGILVFLATPIKDSKYEQVQPLIFSLLNPEIHKISLKRIKQYIMVSSVFKKISKLNGGYPIKQILKPEKENVNERINLLINANKYFEKIAKEHEADRVQIKLKKHLVQDLRKKLESRNQEIEQVKTMKEKQKSEYEEKVNSIQNLNREINYKKKEKLDLLNSQQSLENELKKKNKAVTENSYSNEDIAIRITQLEREVIRNAPKLKKQRLAIIEQYENTAKFNKQQFEVWGKKIAIYQDKLRAVAGLREKSKTFRNQQRCKQLEDLSLELSQLSNKMKNGQDHKQQTCNSKKQILKTIQALEKNKIELQENTSHEERQLALHEQAHRLLKEDQQKHRVNVKVIEEKNSQSISQYRALEDKIKYKREKIRQRILEYNLRLRSMEEEMRQIVQEAFMQFN